MRKTYLKEAIELFDDGDTRSFNELYEGKEDLFSDVDTLIHPKFKKLFEETYLVGNEKQTRLREARPDWSAPDVDPVKKIDSTFNKTKKTARDKVLGAINGIAKSYHKVITEAYAQGANPYIQGLSDSAMEKLFLDVKMGRKTAREAATQLIRPRKGGWEDFKGVDQSEGERVMADGMTRGITEWGADALEYGDWQSGGFIGGGWEVIKNAIKFPLRMITRIAGFVVLPIDLIRAAKALASSLRFTKGSDVEEYYHKVQDLVEKMFEAAVKNDKGLNVREDIQLTDPDTFWNEANAISEQLGLDLDNVLEIMNNASSADEAAMEICDAYQLDTEECDMIYDILDIPGDRNCVSGILDESAKKKLGRKSQFERIYENGLNYGPANGYRELDNRNDGVPGAINRSGFGGSRGNAVRQSTPNHSSNAPLSRKFESIFKECSNPSGAADNNPRSGPKPGGDGVPGGHNRRGMGGSDPATNQSTPGHHSNAKLGHEPAMGYGNGPKKMLEMAADSLWMQGRSGKSRRWTAVVNSFAEDKASQWPGGSRVNTGKNRETIISLIQKFADEGDSSEIENFLFYVDDQVEGALHQYPRTIDMFIDEFELFLEKRPSKM
jgi:antitoxin component of RelBE/YafQ-DinJ toxin-antitoxin module